MIVYSERADLSVACMQQSLVMVGCNVVYASLRRLRATLRMRSRIGKLHLVSNANDVVSVCATRRKFAAIASISVSVALVRS
jgi:hypothetical protein